MTQRLLTGDARQMLGTLEAESVDLCVTSPPFYGLRSYNTEPQVWGAAELCEHRWNGRAPGKSRDRQHLKELGERLGCGGGNKTSGADYSQNDGGAFCQLCGCWRGELGSEPDPALYVAHIVEVFAEVRRVLKPTGLVFINLGSSYASSNMRPSQSRQPQREPAYGNDGKEQPDCPVIGRVFRCSDDAHRVCCQPRCLRIAHNGQRPYEASSEIWPIARDKCCWDCAEASLGASVPAARESTRRESSRRPGGLCLRWASNGDCPLSCATALPSAHPSKSCEGCICDIASREPALGLHSSDRESSFSACMASSSSTMDSLAWPYQNVKYAAKQLIDIPHLVAHALQADGWWLRAELPWVKRNALPSSTKDRPGVAHEYVLMLSKSARYFWDRIAVMQESTGQTGQAVGFKRATKETLIPNQQALQHRMDRESTGDNGSRNFRTSDPWLESLDYLIDDTAAYLGHLVRIREDQGMLCDPNGDPLALLVNTRPSKAKHYATYSDKLVEPLIRGGSSERGCCAKCGRPWERMTETTPNYRNRPNSTTLAHLQNAKNLRGCPNDVAGTSSVFLGWRPTCECGADTVPAVVLDPFSGTGSSGVAALKLGRDYIGIDLLPAYQAIAEAALAATALEASAAQAQAGMLV